MLECPCACLQREASGALPASPCALVLPGKAAACPVCLPGGGPPPRCLDQGFPAPQRCLQLDRTAYVPASSLLLVDFELCARKEV